MKSIIKGMTLLLAGASFVACSKDVAFDENAQKEAKAEAEIAQKFATYQSDFVKAFGTIASGHQWGFDQTTGRNLTRTAVTSINEYWLIPANLLGGSQNKEGFNANDMEAEFHKDTPNQTVAGFDFNNYFLQHVEQPKDGSLKNSVSVLQAYNSNTKAWEDVTNFSKGKNNSSFNLDIDETYFYANPNRSAAGTTLMKNMGGQPDPETGKMFRLKLKNNKGYNYNYCFITTDKSYHKEIKGYITESFLGFYFGSNSFWVIRLGEAKTASEDIKAEGRVFCEDMGANDFDFNDVVFDAWIMGDGTIKIKVLAHGGVLPIAIDGVNVKLGEMTNTGVNEDDYQEFTIPAKNSNKEPKYKSIDAIPVTVNPNGAAGNTYNLEAKIGDAPQKVCAPVGTLWPKEYKKIGEAYSPFTTWVSILDPAEWTAKMDPDLVYHTVE